jgi:hypothetical protein
VVIQGSPVGRSVRLSPFVEVEGVGTTSISGSVELEVAVGIEVELSPRAHELTELKRFALI